MPRPRKTHNGKTVEVEIAIRIPGHASVVTGFDISTFKTSVLRKDQNAQALGQKIEAALVAVYGRRGVKQNDFSGGG